MKVLLIEDEKAAARNLGALIHAVDPSIEVVGVLDSVVGAVEWIGSHPKPDLVFMDIHLADGSAFDIFDRCTIDAPVVFTTAYDEYAIKAFKVNSIDYLLKPISEGDLARAIGKFSKLHAPAVSLQPLLRAIRTRLLVPQGADRLVPLDLERVAYFSIAEGIVRATTSDLKSYVVPHTLDQLAEMLAPDQFFRANRQYIVSKSDVAHMELWFGGRLSVTLQSSPELSITINRPRVSKFKAWLTGVR